MSTEYDELLSELRSGTINFDDEAIALIQSHTDKAVLEAKRDTISDMIIECYNHDNPIDIAEELHEERRKIEAELNKLIHKEGE